ANLTITAQPQTITYGASVPATTVIYAGFVNGDTASSLTTLPTISSAQSGVLAAGTYTGNYTASGATDPNYSIFYVPGNLVVGQVSLTITAQPQTITYGTSVPTTTVSYSGFVNGDSASSLTTQPTISSALSGVVAVGNYPGNYTVSGAVDPNYSISYVPGTLTVNAAPQPIIKSIVVANGTATITFAGTNGVTYVTQSTTNLAVNAWIPISTNTPGLSGGWTVTNSISNVSKQFYRTLIP
ncbi:MAG: MBG domain-containing protein, partial [Limisphaerales bacterium]